MLTGNNANQFSSSLKPIVLSLTLLTTAVAHAVPTESTHSAKYAAKTKQILRTNPSLIIYPAFADNNHVSFYGGANIGSVNTSADWGFNNVTGATGVPDAGNANTSDNNLIGGLQLGMNFRSNNILMGVEGDFNFANVNIDRTANSLPGASLPFVVTQSYSSDWLSSVRARAGYAWNNFYVFGTGGFAFGQVSQLSRVCFPGLNFGTACGAASSTEIETGYAAGAGVEWQFAPDWSARGQYMHYDLGGRHANAVATFPNGVSLGVSASHDFNMTADAGSFAINYTFDRGNFNHVG